MGLALAVVYDEEAGAFRTYFEADVDWIRHYGFKPWLLPTVTGGLS